MVEKILVIDDDPGLVTLLQLGLERDGYKVITADNGKEGLRVAYESRPDVIILDLMMPDMDGWTTCQRLRNICDTPIVMLTAKSSQADILRGLSIGADDYLTKPCNFDELKARIRTVLRRTNLTNAGGWRATYDDGSLHIDLTEGMVKRDGETLDLTPTESKLLLYLVSQKGRVVPHKELLMSIWGPEYEKEIGYLSVYVRYLRQKLEDNPSNPQYVRTRWGIGYYFAGKGALQQS
ncbi:MAG: response regulator transcription factor [Anaerolineae bacterium]|nr:response regulator transcription factor [Anaerolineae bacterium]